MAGAAVSDLSVTSPAGLVTATPGKTATTTITVGNIGSDPLDVSIRPAEVQLADNGATHFENHADPLFGGRTTISPTSVHLGGYSNRTVTITVRIPRRIGPDDYFLGFLVSPIITANSVAVVNDVGSLVVLDVPGPRDERLAARFVNLPYLSFSSSASGNIEVKSVGRSTARFTTDTQFTGFPAPKSIVVTEPPQLLPPRLTRNEPVHVSSWLGVGWTTIHATLIYNITDSRTGEVTLSRTVILLDPLWFGVPVAAVLSFFLLRRNRKRRRRPLHAARPKASSRTPVGVR